MKTKDKLAQYIATTRRTKPAPLATYYEQLFDLLRCLSPGDAFPRLHTTYSVQRRCEVISLDDEVFLVYDQYLGQTINTLNRVFFASPQNTAEAALMYACKYLAENLRVRQRDRLALFFARGYHSLRERVHLPPTSANQLQTTLVMLQEVYVISHEIFHYLCKCDDKMRTSSLRRAVIAFEACASGGLKPEAVQSHAERYGTSMNSDDLRQTADTDFEQWRTYMDRYSEEVASDFHAAESVCDFAARYTNIDFRYIPPALVLVYRHLRFLRLLDEFLADLLKEPRRSCVPDASEMRAHLLRWVLEDTPIGDPSAAIWDDLYGEMQEMHARYNELIEANVFHTLSSWMPTPRKIENEAPSTPTEKLGRAVDHLTGWLPWTEDAAATE